MADKKGYDRKVWLIPHELAVRLVEYQARMGVASEVEAARRLLSAALQQDDGVDNILETLRQRYGEIGNLRLAVGSALVGHIQVESITFEGTGVLFRLKCGATAAFDPSVRAAPSARILDRWGYPNLQCDAGDCCTKTAGRNRKTPFGTMWLCEDHFRAPLAELTDGRLSSARQRDAAPETDHG